MATYQVIGTSTRRVDGDAKVTGQARYAADVALPGTLWGKSLHSPYAHARILRIDTTAAQRVPGVHAVITGADVRAGLWGRMVKDVPVLAYDRVRFFGERVAAVAADDEDIAEHALNMIEVEYDELPAVFDPLDAIADDAPILHPDFNTYNTMAAYEAAQNIKHELLRLAATHLDCPQEALIFTGDTIHWSDREHAIRWPDLLARTGEAVSARAHIEVKGRAHITSFAVQVVEVSVDPETGEIRLLRFTTAHDVGQIVHPIGHQGQINGAIMQGLGYALMEELAVEDGRVTTLSFGEYKMPTMRALPPLTTVLVESTEGVGPYHIKGIGESPMTPVAPAIANAVADAIGVRLRDLPLTAEKVHRALTRRK